jgi:formylglycine-generating enzyme required for sulfatase activity
MIAALLLGALTAASPDDLPASTRIEVRVETVANRDDGSVESCEVVQLKSANSSRSLASWAAVDGKGAEPRGVACRCGAGAFTGNSTAAPAVTPAPILIHELSADVGWSAGAMDPGPFGALVISLTLTSRQLTGFAADGKPLYTNPAKQIRSTRLEPGEEFVLPVPLDSQGCSALGVHEVLLRIRAGWAGREGATEYGALAVLDAAPGSEVVLDGGAVGRALDDGTLLLPSVPTGQRELRIRGVSGPVVTRGVLAVNGRTVAVAPGAPGGASPLSPTLTPTQKNSEGFQEYRRVRDEAIMIQIPEGEFLMGNLQVEGAPLPHTVYVSSFLIDKLPLTAGRFKRFAAATGRPLPPDPYWGVHDDFPVAFMRWDEAKAYCEWAGGRLPTEAEREKATRGTDGRMFPWGSAPPSAEHAVFGRYWGQAGNDAVGGRPAGASPYGVLDSEGNMWESCEDWWDPDYYQSSPRKDPAGPRTGTARVERGGSWDSRWVTLSASRRNFAFIGYREGDFGFRCASDLPR